MPDEGTKPETLYARRSGFHDITVEQKDGVRVMRFGGRLQCAVDAEATDRARTPAQDYLHLPVALVPDATRTLMIGLGGGALARSFVRDYPRMTVDVVELDPAVISIAHQYFGLCDGERLRVVNADGRDYVETSEETYDIIILDALFEAYTPFPLVTEEYLAAVRSRLTPGGVYAHNAIGYLIGEHSGTYTRYLRTLCDAFDTVHMFGVKPVYNQETGRRNYVILATDAPLSAHDVQEAVRSRGGGAVTLERFPDFAEDLLPVPGAVSHARPLTDAEKPEDGLLRS